MATPSKDIAPTADDRPAEAVALERRIVKEHAVRLHLALILATCFGAGLIVTKLLLMAGVHAMWLRYSAALVAAYATFLLGIRLWLAWCGYGARLGTGAGNAVIDDSTSGGGSWSFPGSRGGGGSGGFRGGGGTSGGGGASASFAESGASGSARSAGLFSASSSASGSASRGGKQGGSFDLGGDGDGLVLLALIALVVAVFGAAGYLVYIAPTILSDAAFAALLSGGLVRSTRRIGDVSWVGSVVRATWWPFAIVFVLALVFALTAQHYYPEAATLRDVIHRL